VFANKSFLMKICVRVCVANIHQSDSDQAASKIAEDTLHTQVTSSVSFMKFLIIQLVVIVENE